MQGRSQRAQGARAPPPHPTPNGGKVPFGRKKLTFFTPFSYAEGPKCDFITILYFSVLKLLHFTFFIPLFNVWCAFQSVL